MDRVVSQFHYLRSVKRWRNKTAPPQEWFKKDLASCVKSGDLECQVRAKLPSPCLKSVNLSVPQFSLGLLFSYFINR